MPWTPQDATDYLESLELFGWRLGLERMRKLTSVMGFPQNRFASIHVVGTNGKSSVARMIAALLDVRGIRAGAYVSPHVGSWSERILIGDEPVADDVFAASVERTAQAAETVNRTLEEGEAVTQFEALTAAAFHALAASGVDVAAIEAGLGGRLDATNTIPSRMTVLTSIGLDHTEWLGESEVEIASEKLAVLHDHTTLVCGQLGVEVAELARRTAEERNVELVWAPSGPGPDVRLRAPGGYQRRNFSVAMSAVEAWTGSENREADRAVAESLQLSARMQLIGGEPPLLLDAAHNADGARALAEALPEVADGRPVVGCIAILADKDARAMASALAPLLAHAVCTEVPAAEVPGPADRSSLSATELASELTAAGVPATEAVTDPRAALDRARELAGERGGVALVTGSIYLLSHLWTARRAQS